MLLEGTSHATEAAQHDMAPTTTLDAQPTPIPRAGHSRPGIRLPRSMAADATTTNARPGSIETTGTGTSAPEEAGHVATTVMAVAGAGTVMAPVGTAATLETPTAVTTVVTGWIGVTGTTSAVHAIVHRTTSRQGLVTGMPVVVAGTTGTGGVIGASVVTGTKTMPSLATSVAVMSVGSMIATVIAGIVTTAVVGVPTVPGRGVVTGTTGMPMTPTPTPWSGRPPILASSTPRR